MEKREDYWWRESTLGEDVDGKVGTYLRANHQEYQEIRHQIDELIQQYPAVRELFESEDAVRKAFPNAKFCLHLWDSVRNLKGVDKVFSFFDFITSFDSEDCKKYKLKFRPLFFCDEYRNIESDNKSYDFVFIGTIHSDRYKVIKKLKDSLDEKYQNFYYLFLQNKFIYYCKCKGYGSSCLA